MYPGILDGVNVWRPEDGQQTPQVIMDIVDRALKALVLDGVPIDIGAPQITDSDYFFKQAARSTGFRQVLLHGPFNYGSSPDQLPQIGSKACLTLSEK